MESEIQNHCEKEGKKSLLEVSATYRIRLENVINRAVRKPYCWPYCKTTNCSVIENVKVLVGLIPRISKRSDRIGSFDWKDSTAEALVLMIRT